MSTMRKKMGLSIKDRMDSYHMSFENDEFLKSLEKNIVEHPDKSVYSNGKRLWVNGHFPEVMEVMERQLRKKFNIGDNKVNICLYEPPEKNSSGKYIEKFLNIKENKSNVMARFVLSSIHELCEVSFGNAHSDSIEFRPWVAYKTPDMIGGMLTYKFTNDRNLILPEKKGFRQVRKTKYIDKRYIIVFDYLISKRELQELSNLMSKNKETEETDQGIEDALEMLKDEN